MEHTKILPTGDDSNDKIIVLDLGNNRIESICRCWNDHDKAEANAERLVNCWNSHDDLLGIKEIIQDESDRLDARIADGKHNDAWPNPEYIKDDDWAGMIGERLVYHRVLKMFEDAIAAAQIEPD